MSSEIFSDEIINNLPENPHDAVKVLLDGFIAFAQKTQSHPLTHHCYEKCIDGYAYIFAYNRFYNLGLNLLNANSGSKQETIQALMNSVIKVQHKLGVI